MSRQTEQARLKAASELAILLNQTICDRALRATATNCLPVVDALGAHALATTLEVLSQIGIPDLLAQAEKDSNHARAHQSDPP